MGDHVLHFEVGSSDNAALKRFYPELFSWGLSELEGGYTLIDTCGGGGISGGISRSSDGSSWVCFADLRAEPGRRPDAHGRPPGPCRQCVRRVRARALIVRTLRGRRVPRIGVAFAAAAVGLASTLMAPIDSFVAVIDTSPG